VPGLPVVAWSRSGKVDNKSNEITAIPELLKLLEITGCIITIDAMGTQKAIAASIIDQKADYILALKGNQGNLHKAVKQWFEQARTQQFEGIEHSYYETRESAHDRLEIRQYWTVPADVLGGTFQSEDGTPKPWHGGIRAVVEQNHL